MLTGCVKAKNGDNIMEKDKILERWAENIGNCIMMKKELSTKFRNF